jgi:septal ring factor EnvC (AmiA/AmiB activator)
MKRAFSAWPGLKPHSGYASIPSAEAEGFHRLLATDISPRCTTRFPPAITTVNRNIVQNAFSLCVILRSKRLFFEVIALMSANAVDAPLLATAADFQALEKKVLRTIELLKSAREAQATAERDANRLREQLAEREEEVETMRSEVIALRKEREEVRTRVEKMLTQIDSLTAEESA